MKKSELKVLIVDDDQTISKAMSEIVSSLGFTAVLSATPTEALNQLKTGGAHLAIVDCLLPKMSGVELAKAMLAEAGASLTIILTSAVYKDRGFIKDALQKTGASHFISKPFQIAEFKEAVSKALEGRFDEAAAPLEAMLTSVLSPAEKVIEINSIESIQAYDVPWLCCSLMNSKLTGILRFEADQEAEKGKEREKFAIHFLSGQIVQVEMKNSASFFGSLLVEKGYLSPSQIEKALLLNSPKKLGERLVDLNALSPHVISQTNAEQTAIRLSKIISEAVFTIHFSEQPITDSSAGVDTETIAPFLIDWLHSKIQPAWLRQRYMKWLDSPPTKNANFQIYQRLWNLPPIKKMTELVSSFAQGTTLNQAISRGQYKEELIFQVFHLLIITGYLQLKREFKPGDEAGQMTRLKKILGDMGTQDYFEILGLNRSARGADVKKTYYELAKVFHPDKIPSESSPTLKSLAQDVFSRMTRAYETLSDDERRKAYLKEIEMGRAEKILKAEAIFEDGKQLLKRGQAPKAKQKFEEALSLRPPTSDLLVHMAWAKLLIGGQDPAKHLAEVEETLNKVPPEDRHNAIYYFVKALFQRASNDETSAKKNLQHALALSPNFTDAERILRAIEQQTKKRAASTDIFRGDLKDVVGSLFRKK